MYTLTWITEKELELELKNIKQRRRILLQGNFIVVVRKLEMLAATKVKMSNSKKMQTNKQTKAHATLISPIKHVTRKFRVVVMKKKNGKEMYKKVCCTSKVVFSLIRPIFFFLCRCHCRRHLALHNFVFLFG